MSDLDGKLQQSEERLTVILASQGDGPAFRILVEAYDRRLLYFIRRILGDSEDAFDVLQSTWLMVHRNLRKLQTPQAFRVWLYRIAHTQTVSALRKQAGEPTAVEAAELSEVAEDSVDEPTFDNAELVHIGLGALSVDHRRVLTLRFLEGMDVAEIADVLECSPGTVKSRLHYAREALRRRIEELVHD
jgi:RNA polymerase sigma-70 factor (ECF subfamily)